LEDRAYTHAFNSRNKESVGIRISVEVRLKSLKKVLYLMPQKTICGDCGFILYEDLDLRSPDEIIEAYNGRCPECGKKLTFVPDNVYIKPAEKESKTVSLPGTEKITHEERAYKLPPTTEISRKEPFIDFEANFLETFRTEINRAIKGFGLFDVSEEIRHVGGFRRIIDDVIVYIRVNLKSDNYHSVKRMVEANFLTDTYTYHERYDPFTDSWREEYPTDVRLKTRIEYQTTLKNKFEKLEKLLKKREDLKKLKEKRAKARSQ